MPKTTPARRGEPGGRAQPAPPTSLADAEQRRITANAQGQEDWHAWGPYLSERQWGTVREDYSEHGEAWDYFPHDLARSRAYRWGEDGIAGYSDREQRLCLGLALWNGQDPILKERLFGLTNAEGNHGEDVKELYYYLDATPSHSYLRMLYKYPQREFPYTRLVEENRARGPLDMEFELLDSGVFDDDRYFDVTVEYARASIADTCMRVTVENRGRQAATLHVIPQLWFRNTWSWQPSPRPEMRQVSPGRVAVADAVLGALSLETEGGQLLLTHNETNPARLWGDTAAAGSFKDAFHEYNRRRQDARGRQRRPRHKSRSPPRTAGACRRLGHGSTAPEAERLELRSVRGLRRGLPSAPRRSRRVLPSAVGRRDFGRPPRRTAAGLRGPHLV